MTNFLTFWFEDDPGSRKSVYKTPSRMKKSEIDTKWLQTLLCNIAGMTVSGINGAGKSVFARNLMKAARDSRSMSVWCFDPPGTLVADCIRDVISEGQSAIERTYMVAPGNPKHPVLPLNPLSVRRPEWMSDYEYEARLACKADYAADLTLSVFGDGGFEGRPLQYKLTSSICRTLAQLGLSLAEYRHFFPDSPFYESFVECLPDHCREEFARLKDLDAATFEKVAGSTKVRFDSIFNTPIMEALLGVADPGQCLDVESMIQDNAIVMFDLASQGVMSPKQRNLIANYYLSELFFAVLNMPSYQWQDHFILIVCDEFPVFANASATASMITELIPQIRKMNMRFCPLFQGIHPFNDGPDSQLLRTLVSNCTNLVFRHKDPMDCEFWGKLLALPELDEKKEKIREYEDQQYVAGNRIVTTVNWSSMVSLSESHSDGEGGATSHDVSESLQEGQTSGISHGKNSSNSHSDSNSKTHTDSNATTDTSTRSHADNVRDAFSTAAARTRGAVDATSNGKSDQVGSSDATQSGSTDSVTNGTSTETSSSKSLNRTKGTSTSSSYNWSRNRQHARTSQTGVAYNQTLAPIYAWRKVVKFLELMSLDDQERLKARDTALLPVGTCFAYAAGKRPLLLEVPLTKERVIVGSQVYEVGLSSLHARFSVLPFYEMGARILEKRKELLTHALQELRRLQQLHAVTIQGRLPDLDDPNSGEF